MRVTVAAAPGAVPGGGINPRNDDAVDPRALGAKDHRVSVIVVGGIVEVAVGVYPARRP